MGPKRTRKSKGQDPPRKQARQSPTTLPSPIQQNPQPSALPHVPCAFLCLQRLLVDDFTDDVLEGIYVNAAWLHRVKCREKQIKADTFVDQTQFIANIRQQESEFVKVFKKAMKANEDNDDVMAFLNHSACLCCGMNQY